MDRPEVVEASSGAYGQAWLQYIDEVEGAAGENALFEYLATYIQNQLSSFPHTGPKNDISVIDFGCGNGILLPHILSKNIGLSQYHGFDINQTLIDECKNRYNSVPNASFYQCNIGLISDRDLEETQPDNNLIILSRILNYLDNFHTSHFLRTLRLKYERSTFLALLPAGCVSSSESNPQDELTLFNSETVKDEFSGTSVYHFVRSLTSLKYGLTKLGFEIEYINSIDVRSSGKPSHILFRFI